MSEVPLYMVDMMAPHVSTYRGTSLVRSRPPPQDLYRALGIVLL